MTEEVPVIGIVVGACPVRPAMDESLGHGVQVAGAAPPEKSCNAAHQIGR